MSYLNSAIQTFNAIVTMSSQNAGVVYLPVAHAATTQEAVLKHRHKLEICLAKAGLYILNVITLQFIKQGSSLQDRRKNTQQALFVVTSDHKDDGAWTKRVARGGTETERPSTVTLAGGGKRLSNDSFISRIFLWEAVPVANFCSRLSGK